MKIVETKKDAVKFSELKTGAIFEHQQDHYIKIQSHFDNANKCEANSVNLCSGLSWMFNNNDPVVPLPDAELHTNR